MSPTDQFSEQVRQAARRIVESSAAALGCLFDLTATKLVRFATTITRCQHDAEDAVQTVLVRVASAPEILLKADQPWPYLLRMVRNEAVLILRRQRREVHSDGLADLLVHRSVDQLDQQDTHRAVWLALRSLPTEQSEVVVLKIWEGLTFQQIGDVLELSPHTAASRYRYALEKLAAVLRSDDAEVKHG